ncbi:MAG: sulfite exporter TauE/SafE family protein [Clostridiales bacterium]|nr:sulfite exporter TauE/SafE family protein [Clostridiales bacterium]MCF8022959.1 sulfite exporter TauE/SafE family protein [Clostridiales bacterium]
MFFPTSGLEVNPIGIILWGILTGYVFSTVGAAGACLTLIGQVTIFKLDKVMPKHLMAQGASEAAANAQTKNTIKTHNLMAVILSPIIAVPKYFKEKRVAIPLAMAVAAGVVFGSIVGPQIPMSLAMYKFWFGIITFIIGLRLAYETTSVYRSKRQKLNEVSKNFEENIKKMKASGNWDALTTEGFKVTNFNIKSLNFTFWGQEFSINPMVAAAGGFVIAIIASMFGLGGGFMLVPYLASIFVLPMFMVSGTSILIVLVNASVAIISYLMKGATPDLLWAGFFLVGVAGGSYLGPVFSKFYKEKYLRWLLAAVLLFYGLRFMGVWQALGLGI